MIGDLRSRCATALCCAVAVCWASSAIAQDVEYAVRGGVAYSDNVDRAAANGRSSASVVVGLDLDAERDTGRLRYDAQGNVDYYEYLESGIGGQVYGGFDGLATYGIIEDALDWSLSAGWRQEREDVLLPISFDNIGSVFRFATGPNLNGTLFGAVDTELLARYERAAYSDRGLDNETLRAQLTLGRRPSRQTFYGIGASFADVSYSQLDGPQTPDFERTEAFLRFYTEGVRTYISADVGQARVKGDNVDDDAPLFRVRLTRQLTPSLEAFVRYTEEFPTSEGATYEEDPPVTGGSSDSLILSATPRLSKAGGVGVEFTRPRTSVRAEYSRLREETVTFLPAQRAFDQFAVDVSHRLTPRSTLEFGASVADDRFEGPLDSGFEETLFELVYTLSVWRALAVDVRLSWHEWRGDLFQQNYIERAVGVFARYGGRIGDLPLPGVEE